MINALPPMGFSLIDILFWLLLFALLCAAILFVFQEKVYSRLSVRITLLIFASGAVTLLLALAYNEITSDTLSSPSERILQIAAIVLGGPVVIGLLAARFVRRPLRQFNKAIASLEQNNYKVQLQRTGISEFDEIFSKFNALMQRLHHEEKLRKDLVLDTSHELNTPLTTMIGQLTAMQEGKYPMTQERVAMLKQQAERLTDLVQQLGAYTKARMPDTDPPQAIRVKQWCDELAGHFRLELEQNGITVHLRISDGLTINASRSALQQILTNLMQNALRYSQATEITITADEHSLTFADNGKGVPAKNLPYLFERFYRVDKSRNRSTGGLGLGLAIVRELAENQGWTIVAVPAKPGLAFVIKFNPAA